MTNAIATPTTPTQKQTVYSYSRLSMFEGCPRQFYHKYIEQRPFPSSPPMITGKIFHLAMQMVIREGYSPEEAAFYAISEENGLPQGERDSSIVKMVNRAYKRLKRHQNEYSDITSELHLVVETDAGFIQLYIDIVIDNPVDDELLIEDFKTGWQPFEANESKQLALYAYLFKRMRGGIVGSTYKGKLIFPRCYEESDTEVIFTDEVMETAADWANSLIRDIESRDPNDINDWPMTTDRSKCNFCPYASLCAGGFVDGLPSDGKPKDDSEAALIGDYILLQEITLKKMKEGLKKYAKDTQKPIVMESGSWDFVVGEANPKVPVTVLIEYAKEHGLDFSEVLETKSSGLKKWISGDDTGVLSSQAVYTTPRSTFKFVEPTTEE